MLNRFRVIHNILKAFLSKKEIKTVKYIPLGPFDKEKPLIIPYSMKYPFEQKLIK